jgi:hypothetical protein
MEESLAKFCLTLALAGGFVGAGKMSWDYFTAKGDEYKKQMKKFVVFLVFISAVPMLTNLVPDVMGNLQTPAEKVTTSVTNGVSNMIVGMFE